MNPLNDPSYTFFAPGLGDPPRGRGWDLLLLLGASIAIIFTVLGLTVLGAWKLLEMLTG